MSDRPAPTAQPPAKQPPAKRPFRWKLYLPYLVLLLLAIAWAVFWFVARDRVQAALEDWFTKEAALGRNWTCPNRQVAGFPMRFELICDKPTFSGTTPQGHAVEGSLGRLLAVAQIYDPNLVIAELAGPLEVREAGSDTSLKLGWETLQLSMRRGSGALERMSVQMKAPRLSLAGPAGDSELSRSASFEAHARRDPGRPPEQDAYDIVARLVDTNTPLADAFLGSAEPATLEIQTTLTQASSLAGSDLPAQAALWRAQGGQLDLALLKLTKGPQRLEGRGVLGIDELNRPAGRITASAAGLGDLIGRFTGRSGGGIGGIAGGLLGGLLGGAPQPGDGGGKAAAPMVPLPPIILANGQVMVGPFRVARLQPLF